MMRHALLAAGLFLVVVAFPQVAQAQAKQGDREVSVAGNLFSTLGGDATTTSGTFLFGVGYFMTDRMQVAVQPILSISVSSFETPVLNSRGVPTGATTTTTNTNTDVGLSSKVVRYLGDASSKIKPYYGASFIISSLKEAGETSFAAGNFGVKNYLTEKAALDFNGSFGFLLKHPGDFQLLQVNVGITYIF